ncbi:hypothetical protein KSS87_016388 [Heliosperma pusillum]|nr:hypothetical protein KSS87_016388 [Heliosperma pusillum]
MYMAYGWPQVLPIEQGNSPSSQKIVYLKLVNRLMLVVAPSHLELWSSSQTTSFYLHIFKVQFTDKRIHVGGKQPSALFLVNIKLLLNEQVPFPVKDQTVSNIICDNKHLLIGLSNRSLYSISWKGEFYGAFDIKCHAGEIDENLQLSYSFQNGTPPSKSSEVHCLDPIVSGTSAISWLELSLSLRILFVLFSDGQILMCSVSKRGLKQAESIKAEKVLGSGDAACVSVASNQHVLAVGTRRGVVELYNLAESALLIRTISLYDWGYSVEDTGPVSVIAWTPDNSAFAVGWKLRGLTVWSLSGCRLMSTIRQIGLSAVSSPVVNRNPDWKYEPMMAGTALIHWDEYGYRLYAVEERCSERILAFSFGKCCLNRGVSGSTYVRQIICGEDRVLLVQSEESDELKMLHLNLPVSYISQNWPIMHVAASADGTFLAVAGLHGLILYDVRLRRWRFFGDITQEQKIQCKGLLWLGKIVVVCNYVDSTDTYELLFYPRYHLDQSSLLCKRSLLTNPIVMDIYGDYILVTYHPFDVHIFHVKLSGEMTPTSNPDLQLSTVRELSIMTAKSPPVSMRFIPDQLPKDYALVNHKCLILRANGELSLLDLDDGHERELTDSVELFWVTCGPSDDNKNLIEEISWLDYSHRGMQVWYPSPGADPFKQEDFLQLDPELEFDREVYPMGLLPNAGVVVGVCQRMSFSACTEFPCFVPSPQAQTILHCLLRHLLQRDKIEEAFNLAQLSAEKTHFSHCLEWLLFTVFEAEISRQNVLKNAGPDLNHNLKKSLLEKTCDLIRNYPEYHDIVVSVARKTDGRHWAQLFCAAGRSTELFEECFQRRWYRTAACYILVIAKLEGTAVSQYCALRLLQATLDDSLYELAGELVRFLLRSGREYEQVPAESDGLSPRFLGFLLFSSKKQSTDSTSIPSKERSAHVTSIKNILESHASYLMSGKELSKLVAFVKGTQFDVVEFLQRERFGCARLENFASGLELIGQKLQMDTLQSRLDAEFLLAHMCSVKFKEWIVVLATLLRRSEVLFDLFRHDTRLWNAYYYTLQSQPAFGEYNDLLEDLEERLSSTPDLQEP